MKHRLPPLDALKAFESAARHLSFTLAAEELCISKGAISYQIRKLEEVLQCSLFKRSVRQVYLTDAGQMLLHTTTKLFAELGDTLERLQGEGAQASVSVAATTYVAARWLSSRISRFNEQYREVAVLLQHSVNSADFRLADVDLAIRWGACPQLPILDSEFDSELDSGLNSRLDPSLDSGLNSDLNPGHFARLPMPLFPAISPKLLARLTTDSSHHFTIAHLRQEPLNSVPLLCEDRPQDLWQEWLQVSTDQAPFELKNTRRIISDANVRVQAAIDGQGLILADDLMLNELDNGLLLAPFKEVLSGYGYVFMSSPSRIMSDNALTLKSWLMSHIADRH